VTTTPPPERLLRRLDLAVTRRLDGMLHGDHQGLLPGPGSEPGESRPYTPGDDVRRMDWAVTARTAVPHVRLPIADRELETWVVADLSASLDFGTALVEKRDLALSAVAAVGFLTARVGNRIGALLLTPQGLGHVPARPGRQHLLGLLHRAAIAPRGDGGGETDLGAALATVGRLAKRRGMVVVVSDFLGRPGWEKALGQLSIRHDVLTIEIVDPRELELPSVGVLHMVDPRSGELFEVQTANPKIRERYAAAAATQRAAIAEAIRAAGSDHLQLRTDRDWLLDVVRFVAQRRERTRDIAPRTSA
jgi:uncharacterized protein (DUF58 family)